MRQASTASNLGLPLVYSYFFAVSCLFAPPTILCLQFGMDSDVVFWIGRWSLLALLVPIFIVVMFSVHIFMVSRGTPRRRIFLWTVAVPAIFFCIMGGLFMNRGTYLYGQLKSNDCSGGGFLPEKVDLQTAYNEAHAIYGACINRLYNDNGQQTLPFRPTLWGCEEWGTWQMGQEGHDEPERDRSDRSGRESTPSEDSSGDRNRGDRRREGDIDRDFRGGRRAARGVPEVNDDHLVQRQMGYLASVESNHVCGGWCEPGPMLWTSYSEVGRGGGKCTPYVAHKFLSVSHQGFVILCLELLTVVVAAVYYLQSSKTLSELGYQ